MTDVKHAGIVAEGQRKKARDMQLQINKHNRSRDDDHSRDEELDNLSEVENADD